jgi:putative transposase
MRAIKVRIYPKREQIKHIEQSFGCARLVYNKALAFKKDRYDQHGDSIGFLELSKILTFWKRTEELSFLKNSNAQGLQQSLRHLESAYKKFFKEGKGFPKFKKKHDSQSYSVVGGVSVVDNKIKFPKVGLLNCKGLREFSAEIKTATISRNKVGQYFLAWCVNDVEKKEKPKEIRNPVGIDVGIKSMATASTGEKFESKNHLAEIENKLKYYQRRQAKCKKGSRAFKKWKYKVARLWKQITDIKKDFLHKLSLQLVKSHDLIAVENLKIANMLKNHKLAKSIQNMSWYEFFRMLEYKCEWYGVHFVKVPPHNTSKRCSTCGALNKELTLEIRHWTCSECEDGHDRDINAGKNIEKEGVDSVLKFGGVTVAGLGNETRIPCL